MVPSNPRELIWESLLIADFRMRYFEKLSSSLHNRQRWLAISNGVVSSGALILVFQGSPRILVGLVAVAAILSWASVLFQQGSPADAASQHYRRWCEIGRDYDRLWVELESGDLSEKAAMRRWEALEASHSDLDEQAAKVFKTNDKLSESAFSEMLSVRGLSHA